MTQPAVGEPHLAFQLRRLADALAKDPDRNDVQRHAEKILTAGVLLWTAGQSALTKSAQWAGPWPAGGGGPTGKGSHSDPTSSAALDGYPRAEPEDNETPRPTLPDAARRNPHPERRYHQRLVTAVNFAVDNATEISQVIVAVHEKSKRERPTDECCEPRCSDTAEPGRKGRCSSCAKWRQRWLASHPGKTPADVPPVPADVIDDRRVKRRRRSA